MKWLAVDYGDSRTGLAGCDAGETITSPITPQIEEKSMNKVAAAVTAVAQARGAEALVCGLPKNMDGTEGSRANKSRRFAQRLANTANLSVVLWDERRTTVSAAAILADNDTFGAKRKERLDSVSAAVFGEICRKAEVPVMIFHNRSDMAGGSTLGNISNGHLSLNTVDIGIPQLAMHSCVETAGEKDTAYMVKAMTAFYNADIRQTADGMYTF